MKFISILLFIAAASVSTFAQQSASAAPKAASELLASSEKIVRGAPFSAEAISESIQVLVDGNRIIRTSTNKMFRDSNGRFRREGISNPGTAFGAYFEMQPTILILDPVNGFKYVLNLDSKTARKYTLRIPRIATTVGGKFFTYNAQGTVATATTGGQSTGPGTANGGVIQGTASSPAAAQSEADAATAAKKAREEFARAAETFPKMADAAKAELEGLKTTTRVLKTHNTGTPFTEFGNAAMIGLGYKTESKVEDLGKREFEGVEADGTRTITTIPAGAIGNERPIDIIYERWYSKDLEMILSSKHSDPRFGDQTYKLVNIIRVDPELTLFTLPADFKLLTDIRGTVNVAIPKPAMPSTPPVFNMPTPKPPMKAPGAPAKITEPAPAAPKPVI